MMEAVDGLKTAAAGAEAPKMCGFCTSMGDLAKAGAKEEAIDTKTGSIYLVTSTDSAILAKIHAVADQAIAEAEAMEHAAQ